MPTDNSRPSLNPQDVAHIWVATTACLKYVEEHGGTPKQAADAIRATLSRLLDNGTWRNRPNGTWILYNADHRIQLAADLRMVFSYREGKFAPGGTRKTSDQRARRREN